MSAVGENIAFLRRQKGMTQETLATMIGVSAQSISKWENNTNMPDIMLLPIISDVFGITIDELFGRSRLQVSCDPDDVFEICCADLLEKIASTCYRTDWQEDFAQFVERYRNTLKLDDCKRTSVVRNHGIVYYGEKLGGLLLKKPENGWANLPEAEEAKDVLQLLNCDDFRRALATIIRAHMTTFTLPSLCTKCRIEDAKRLEELLIASKLFVDKKIDVGDEKITVYELVSGQRLFLLFAVLSYACEYANYSDNYICYHGDSSYYFD